MKHALITGSSALTPTQRKSIGVGKYVPRERHPDEALPPQIDKMAGTYKPPTWQTRDRSMDHQSIKSLVS